MSTSRFAPDAEQMRDMVLRANERAERLALRIVNARAALLRGQSNVGVLAILEGAEDD